MEEFSQLKFSLLSSDPDPGLGQVDKKSDQGNHLRAETRTLPWVTLLYVVL